MHEPGCEPRCSLHLSRPCEILLGFLYPPWPLSLPQEGDVPSMPQACTPTSSLPSAPLIPLIPLPGARTTAPDPPERAGTAVTVTSILLGGSGSAHPAPQTLTLPFPTAPTAGEEGRLEHRESLASPALVHEPRGHEPRGNNGRRAQTSRTPRASFPTVPPHTHFPGFPIFPEAPDQARKENLLICI